MKQRISGLSAIFFLLLLFSLFHLNNVSAVAVACGGSQIPSIQAGSSLTIDCTVSNFSGNTVTNDGTINVTESAPDSFGNTTLGRLEGHDRGLIINNGKIDLLNGELTSQGFFFNNGTIQVREEGFLGNSDRGELNNEVGGKLELTRDPNVTLPEGSINLSNSATLNNSGTLSIGSEHTAENKGMINNMGTIDIKAVDGRQGVSALFGGKLHNQEFGMLNNSGTVNVGEKGDNNDNYGSTLNNAGTLNNSGTVNVYGYGPTNDFGGVVNTGGVVNSGVFMVAADGEVKNTGTYEQDVASATTIVNGTFDGDINLQAGTLSGTGTITGFVDNTGGVVQPGSSVLPGTLTLASYTQGADARLDLKIGGLLAGSQYDVLKVTGPVSLHGSLFVNLIDGFAPKVGNTFGLITGSSFDVGIRQISLPRLLGGMDWLTSFAGGVFGLTVRQVVVSAPEPSSLLLSGVGFAWLVGWRWRKQQNRKATN